jgi:RNA polymerase sigma-70 factor (ECF subfamily)
MRIRAAANAERYVLRVELPGLVESAQSGDVGAVSELYDRYAGVILRYLFARIYERELAQDLTQEVFIRVIKGIGQFTYYDEKSFLGWLYTIAGNVLNSYHRRRKVQSTPLEHQGEMVDLRSQQDVHRICDRVALQQAIDQLTRDQKQVLTLRFFADMSNSEIAATLNRTEGSVKALQYRALQSLQQILAREDERRNDPPPATRAHPVVQHRSATISERSQNDICQC